MICNQCSNEFEGRKDAKYCSPVCRATASRNAKRNISATPVTDKPVNVTPESIVDVAFSMPDVVGEFEDLPADVQRAIEYMSQARSELLGIDYEDEKAIRTARALHYQVLFPDGQTRAIA